MELKDIEKEIQTVYNGLNSSYEPYIITKLYNEPDSFSNVKLKLKGTKFTFCIDKVLREIWEPSGSATFTTRGIKRKLTVPDDLSVKEWEQQGPSSREGSQTSPPNTEAEERSSETEKIDMTDEEFKSALKRLADCLEPRNLDSINKIQQMGPDLKENDLVAGIGVHIVKKLAGNVLTSRNRSRNPCPCGCEQKLDALDKMYIGSTETWHGELDLYAVGETSDVGVNIVTNMDGGDEDTVEGDSSPGTHTPLEVKQNISNTQPYRQIASETIVFAYTQLNQHPDICPYIPSVFIEHRGFQVWMYNPNTDGLIGRYLSCYFIDDEQEGLRKYGGLIELWAVLNHRIFFRKKPQLKFEACSFQNKVEERLEKYQTLIDFKERVQTTSGLKVPLSPGI